MSAGLGQGGADRRRRWRVRGVVAVLVVTAVAATPLGAASTAMGAEPGDVTAPVLSAVSRSGGGPGTGFVVGDRVALSWAAADASGVRSVSVSYRDAADKVHNVSGYAGATGAAVTLDTSWANGPTRVASVAVIDTADNLALYLPDGTVQNVPGAPSRHGLDLAALAFTVAGTSGDATPPQLVAIRRDTPATAAPGDRIGLSWTATDASGVKAVVVELRDSAGKVHPMGSASGATSAEAVVGPGWAAGPVTVDSVVVHDNAGNYAAYRAAGAAYRYPGGAGRHTVDLTAAALTVSAGGDTTPPTLRGITLAAPGPYAPGSSVRMRWDAVDASGVDIVSIVLRDGAGKRQVLRAIGGAPDGAVGVTAAWGPGRVTVVAVDLVDGAGNSVSYRPDGSTVPEPGRPGRHTVPFDALAFEVVAAASPPTPSPAPSSTPVVLPVEVPVVTPTTGPPGPTGPAGPPGPPGSPGPTVAPSSAPPAPTASPRAPVVVPPAAGRVLPARSTAVRIRFVRWDAAGRDTLANRSINGETVQLVNTGRRPVSLTGWTLRDGHGNVYRFPRTVVGAGKKLIVHTGKGTSSPTRRYMGRRDHVWGNRGDGAQLRDAYGRSVVSVWWTSAGRGYSTFR